MGTFKEAKEAADARARIADLAREHADLSKTMRELARKPLRTIRLPEPSLGIDPASLLDIGPPPVIAAVQDSIEHNQASEFYKRLMRWIEQFDAGLDQAHEVGIQLVNFADTVFALESMGYWNPSLVSFRGRDPDTGERLQLIQHVSQINVLLRALRRDDPDKPKQPIGFVDGEPTLDSDGD